MAFCPARSMATMRGMSGTNVAVRSDDKVALNLNVCPWNSGVTRTRCVPVTVMGKSRSQFVPTEHRTEVTSLPLGLIQRA
ncbi:hypothetical protein [Lysobacter gummosus]|uniref:hypothetical protein n=1 Tax=Lysobacter gummosus TaxID=262324 RepID=UPI003645F38B